MRGRDDLPGAPGDEVVGGLGHDAAGPHELVVLVQDEAGPGELVGGGLATMQPARKPD